MLIAMGGVGYKSRLFPATTILLRLATAFVAGYTFAEPFSRALARIAPSLGMPFWHFLAFVLLFVAVFLVLTHLLLVYVEADDVTVPQILDRIGGVAVGVASGALLGGALLLAWSLAVTFCPVRFITEEADLKVDLGQIVLHEYGRLQQKMPGRGSFDAPKAIETYRDADKAAVKRAGSAAPPKEKKEPGKETRAKSKGTAADLEDETSAGSLRRKFQQEQK